MAAAGGHWKSGSFISASARRSAGDNHGFLTPDFIQRTNVNTDARRALESERGIKRFDILSLPDGTTFQVDRVNGMVITGLTARNRDAYVDLRFGKARLISRADLVIQEQLL